MTQPDLFLDSGAPNPGALPAADPAPACSAAARDKVDASRLRRLTEQEFRLFPLGTIADEVVHRLQAMGLKVDYLSIRPRVSELKAAGVLVPTGSRRLNRKGNTCSILVHADFVRGAV